MNVGNRSSVVEGKVLDLPFLGNLLQVEISRPFNPQLLETTSFDMNRLQPDEQVQKLVITHSMSILLMHRS